MNAAGPQHAEKELRFQFGRNWARFLSVLTEDRVREAEKSLREMLGSESLAGCRFLDVGSGSGLFSLSARRLGASVWSFDFDPQSVACTRELKRRFFPDDPDWTVEEGSALDTAYVGALGTFDVVYAWGVLHHTGRMWDAMANTCMAVAPGGRLFLAIYNDQGFYSRAWRVLKRMYCANWAGRIITCSLGFPYFVLVSLKEDLVRGKNPLRRYREYKRNRGMSILTDWLDWFGGYPFEVARPEEVFGFCHARGFELLKMKTCGAGLANNEFVFELTNDSGTPSTARKVDCV